MLSDRTNLVRRIHWAVLILLGIILDQWTKWLAAHFLQPNEWKIWPGVLHFTYVENSGAAFGMLADQRWIFMTVSCVAIGLILLYLMCGRSLSRPAALALCLIVSGGIGNMIDRVTMGFVIDYIYVALIDFAVFNFADMLVCVGAGLLFLAILLDYRRERREGKQ